MKSVSVSVAKRTLSALLSKVSAGASITITNRGKPVARLVPLPSQVRGIPAHKIELAERCIVKLPEREFRSDWDRDLPRAPRPKEGASALKALLQERRNGR
jgi:prevent-host-death family protein